MEIAKWFAVIKTAKKKKPDSYYHVTFMLNLTLNEIIASNPS